MIGFTCEARFRTLASGNSISNLVSWASGERDPGRTEGRKESKVQHSSLKLFARAQHRIIHNHCFTAVVDHGLESLADVLRSGGAVEGDGRVPPDAGGLAGPVQASGNCHVGCAV